MGSNACLARTIAVSSSVRVLIRASAGVWGRVPDRLASSAQLARFPMAKMGARNVLAERCRMVGPAVQSVNPFAMNARDAGNVNLVTKARSPIGQQTLAKAAPHLRSLARRASCAGIAALGKFQIKLDGSVSFATQAFSEMTAMTIANLVQ